MHQLYHKKAIIQSKTLQKAAFHPTVKDHGFSRPYCIKSVAILTGKTTGEVVMQIGAEGVARLMHNAPMNQLLQYGRIVGEIIHDYDFHASREYEKSSLEPDRGYGYYVSALVAARTHDHHAFPQILYNLLAEAK